MGFVADAVKSVGKAIGGVVDGIGKAVQGIASTVGGIAGAVTGFIKNNPLGQFLQAIPGIGSIVSGIGKAADMVKNVAGTVGDVAGFAMRLGEQIAGIGADASGLLSPTNLGFLGSAVESFTSMDGILGLAEGVSSLFDESVQRTEDQQEVADLGQWNLAQLFAKRQAELL
jgi:hypothetical protein